MVLLATEDCPSFLDISSPTYIGYQGQTYSHVVKPGDTITLPDEYYSFPNIKNAIDAGYLEVVSYASTPGSVVTNAELTEIGGGGGGATTNEFHVDDYGAVGDGTTNDFVAITAAIAAATAAGGGKVVFGPKQYATNSTIDLVSSVFLEGAGMSVTTIKRLSDVICFEGDTISKFGISKMTIDSNTWTENSIQFEDASLFHIDSVFFANLDTYGTGLSIATSTHGILNSLRSTGGGSSAVEISSSSLIFGSGFMLDGTANVGINGINVLLSSRIQLDKIDCNGFSDTGSGGTGVSIANSTQCFLRGQTSNNLTGLTDSGPCTDSVYEFISTSDTTAKTIGGTGSTYVNLASNVEGINIDLSGTTTNDYVEVVSIDATVAIVGGVVEIENTGANTIDFQVFCTHFNGQQGSQSSTVSAGQTTYQSGDNIMFYNSGTMKTLTVNLRASVPGDQSTYDIRVRGVKY